MENKNYFSELVEEQGFLVAITTLFDALFSGKLMSEIAPTQRLLDSKKRNKQKLRTSDDIMKDLKKRGLWK